MATKKPAKKAPKKAPAKRRTERPTGHHRTPSAETEEDPELPEIPSPPPLPPEPPSPPPEPVATVPGPEGNWKPIFLFKLKSTANVRLSCDAAGIGRSWAYESRILDPEFAKAWKMAMDDAMDMMEAVAFHRARGTPEVPGSDGLLIFLLKSHRREVYGDKIDVSGRVATEMVINRITVKKSVATTSRKGH